MEIRKLACIGSGLIGSGWATLFSKEGYPVTIYDIDSDAVQRGEKYIQGNFDKFVSAGIMSAEQAREAFQRIGFTTDLKQAVCEADFIQECSPEILAVKQALLKDIDRYNAQAIFASSTSALRISDIAAESSLAARCIGAHPYNPPHLIPLVELTKGERTDERYMEAAYAFYRKIKKEPVILNKEAVGFIANRLQAAYTREAVDLVMKGVCSVEDVDKASLYGLGFRYAIIGPNLNGHLNGGEGGLREYYRKYHGVFEDSLKDNMGTWTEFPEAFMEQIGPEGVEAEMAGRAPEQGNSRQEIVDYRDAMLLEILKLHGKL